MVLFFHVIHKLLQLFGRLSCYVSTSRVCLQLQRIYVKREEGTFKAEQLDLLLSPSDTDTESALQILSPETHTKQQQMNILTPSLRALYVMIC